MLSILSEHHQVIGNAHTAHRSVLLHLLVQQAKSLCALHLRDGVLPYRHPAVIDKSSLLERTQNHAGEIPQTDISLLAFLDRQIHAMDSHVPTAPQHPVKLFHQIVERREKLLVILTVPPYPPAYRSMCTTQQREARRWRILCSHPQYPV